MMAGLASLSSEARLARLLVLMGARSGGWTGRAKSKPHMSPISWWWCHWIMRLEPWILGWPWLRKGPQTRQWMCQVWGPPSSCVKTLWQKIKNCSHHMGCQSGLGQSAHDLQLTVRVCGKCQLAGCFYVCMSGSSWVHEWYRIIPLFVKLQQVFITLFNSHTVFCSCLCHVFYMQLQSWLHSIAPLSPSYDMLHSKIAIQILSNFYFLHLW